QTPLLDHPHHAPRPGHRHPPSRQLNRRLKRPQCLDRRIGDLHTLNAELTAWQNATNTDQRQMN
ncbi:hypothetical protein ACIOWI_37380, partial [Streptomyces sp. NPDC087659]|uniref:hypothetical protein n=1 Tax=Streptomyces sp. NPDC087659 TaxID=3365801 RepID=UPI0038262267